jgi:hypothetical protein
MTRSSSLIIGLKSGRELGAGVADCVSSVPGVSRASTRTPASHAEVQVPRRECCLRGKRDFPGSDTGATDVLENVEILSCAAGGCRGRRPRGTRPRGTRRGWRTSGRCGPPGIRALSSGRVPWGTGRPPTRIATWGELVGLLQVLGGEEHRRPVVTRADERHGRRRRVSGTRAQRWLVAVASDGHMVQAEKARRRVRSGCDRSRASA